MRFAGVDGVDAIDLHSVDAHGHVAVRRIMCDRCFAVDDFAHGGDGFWLRAFNVGPDVTVQEAVSESDYKVGVTFGLYVVRTHAVGKPMHARTT